MIQPTSYSGKAFKGVLDEARKKHLLSRALFGCTKEDLSHFQGMEVSAIIEELLTQSPSPSPPINYYQSKLDEPDPDVAEGETWVNALYGDGNINFRRRLSLRYWWIQNMMFQKPSLEEKMILFWHNHFATQIEIYDNARGAYNYQNTIRKHVFGNFKEFVKAITIEPAMLEYLNGQRNSKNAPDENYARELQELFTIGKGPESKYIEKDVRETAKVLTGHRYEWENQVYEFGAWDHDVTDKQFSAFYGNKVIKGKTGEDGAKELDELLDMIFETSEVSRFMVRKLYRFFLYYEISDQVEQDFIRPIAKVFQDSNYDIKVLLKAFFESEHFLDPAFHGVLIASPLEFVVKTMRFFQPELPKVENSIYLNYSMTGVLMRVAEGAQQYIGDPPSVSGWPAYYQTPLYQQLWINSDTYQKRSLFIASLFYNELKREDEVLEIDLIKVTEKFDSPEEPEILVNNAVALLLPLPLDQSTKDRIKKDILLSGQADDFYWRDLWNTYQADKSNSQQYEMVRVRLQFLYFYICSLPEYQLS